MRDIAGDEPAALRVQEATPGLARETSLVRLVEQHVLPELALRHPAVLTSERHGDGLAHRIAELTDFALASDDEHAMSLLHALYRDGTTFSQLQLGLLAPSARRLNDLWVEDRASFVDVTLATATLKRLMRFVTLDLIPLHGARPRNKSILIAPAPGDGHDFGAAMAAEYFRRDGWSVRLDPAPTVETLVQRVGAEWMDAAAFSLTTREHASDLAEAVRLVRATSLNPRLAVVVAGEAIVRAPSLMAVVGADAAIAPLPTAPARTYRLVTALFGLGG